MSLFRFEAKIISRNGGHTSTVGAAAYQTGKCATSAAAYRHGDEMTDERTGQTFDYSKKQGVLGSEIVLPPNAPDWMGNRSRLWNTVEAIEKRRDSQLARDFIISLPHELTDPQRRALLKEFVGKHLTDRGYVADIAFHAPPKHDSLNWHAHVMVPMRKVDGDGFAKKKERPEGNPKAAWREELAMFREDWAAHVNRHLEAAGIEARVDHRSNEAQGIDREPEPKLGPLAAKIEAEGRDSHAGDDLRAVRARNADRNRLKVELAGVTAEIIDLQLERMKRVATQQDEVAPEVYAKRRDEMQEQVRVVQAQAHQQAQPSDDARMRETLTREAQQQADDAHKHEQDLKRQQDAAAANGDVTDPSLRYAQALGSNHMTRNPYDLLANAALTEYGMFAAQQQKLKEEAAKQEDPTQRRIIQLQAQAEGAGYMWITSQRLGTIADVISGRDNSANGNAYREAAANWQKRGEELRAERAALIEQQREDGRDQSRDTRAPQAQGTDAARAADEVRREGNSNNPAQTGPQTGQQQDNQPSAAPRGEQRPDQSPAEARAQAVSDVLRSNDRVAEERVAEARNANEFQFRSGDVDRQRQARAARSPEEAPDSSEKLAAKIRAMEQSAHRQESASPNRPSQETQPQETRTDSPRPESRDIGAELAAQIRATEQSGRQQESASRDASEKTGGDRAANTGTGNEGSGGNGGAGQGRASGSGGGKGR